MRMGNQLLLYTIYISLIIQFLTGFVDIYALSLHYPAELLIFKNLLYLETAVQIIEGIFYIWLISQFSYISNVTPKRYFDWFITTPTMLFTLCIYLDYLHHKESFEQMDLYGLFQTHKQTFIPIAILNSMMLLFGYLGETKLLNKYLAVLLGFIPFVLFFGMIYDNYAKYTPDGETLFWYFTAVWGFYGIAAIMPYFWKNISYNILDIFSKNFFGLFLAYIAIREITKV
jgi:bacteriorhodopsin